MVKLNHRTPEKKIHMNSFKDELYRKGGAQWISNLHAVSPNTPLTLYATGECTISQGRIYVAFPTTHTLTPQEKAKYNIM
jgi:hypothetical protein